MVLPAMERREAIVAWGIDDTGFPKHGKHSVGVSHQYCGERQAGKLPGGAFAVACQPPREPARGLSPFVPEVITFNTKNEIAREQIEWACEAGLPRGVALMHVSYGKDASLRRRMTELSYPRASASEAPPLRPERHVPICTHKIAGELVTQYD